MGRAWEQGYNALGLDAFCNCEVLYTRSTHLCIVLYFVCTFFLLKEYVPCPVYECKNGSAKIVQQPADLTSLSANLASAATSFIINKAGESCVAAVLLPRFLSQLLAAVLIPNFPYMDSYLGLNGSKFNCSVLSSAAKSSRFFLYYAFQHIHYPQFAGRRFRNSTIRGTFGDSLVGNYHTQLAHVIPKIADDCMYMQFHSESDTSIRDMRHIMT